MTEPVSPLSFLVSVDRLPQKGMPVKMLADEEQREALARTHGLASVESFSAELLVQRWKRDGVRVNGNIRARVVQTCVVTLDPFESLIDEPVSALFVPEGSRLARDETDGGEIVVDVEADDLPETFRGGRVDVGALAEEFFALAIDLYPRRPGAELPQDLPEGDEDGPDGEGPLSAGLRKLAGRR